MTQSNPSGLPDEQTLAERRAEFEAEQAKRDERIDFLVQAFTRLPCAGSEGDLATMIQDELRGGEDGVYLELADLEQIARRIADLNSMAMQGGMVQTAAEQEGRVRAAEAAAAASLRAQVRSAVPQRKVQADELTDLQRRNREAGPDVDSPL